MKIKKGYFESHDGLRLYYETTGTGPALVCCNGIGVSTFFWHYIREYFAERMQIVTWDYRGHNKSQTPHDLEILTMDNNVLDIVSLMNHLAIDNAVLAGHSMGCQVILEFAWTHKDRCNGLVPMFGTFGTPSKTFFDLDLIERIFPLIFHLGTRTNSKMITRYFIHPKLLYPLAKALRIINPMYCSSQDMEPYFKNLRMMDPKVFLHMARHMNKHTTFHRLSQIDKPTLIIAGEKDYFTPLHLSKKMNKLIRSSELLIIPKGSHAAIVEQPELINLRMEKFFHERFQLT